MSVWLHNAVRNVGEWCFLSTISRQQCDFFYLFFCWPGSAMGDHLIVAGLAVDAGLTPFWPIWCSNCGADSLFWCDITSSLISPLSAKVWACSRIALSYSYCDFLSLFVGWAGWWQFSFSFVAIKLSSSLWHLNIPAHTCALYVLLCEQSTLLRCFPVTTASHCHIIVHSSPLLMWAPFASCQGQLPK